jgi:hypothetical protein
MSHVLAIHALNTWLSSAAAFATAGAGDALGVCTQARAIVHVAAHRHTRDDKSLNTSAAAAAAAAAVVAGDALGVCELMLGLPRMSQLTADSMVQALLVPTSTFLQLVGAVAGIRTRAWQATAAQLAAQHHHILGQHRQLAPLNIFFRSSAILRLVCLRMCIKRCARVCTLTAGSHSAWCCTS